METSLNIAETGQRIPGSKSICTPCSQDALEYIAHDHLCKIGRVQDAEQGNFHFNNDLFVSSYACSSMTLSFDADKEGSITPDDGIGSQTAESPTFPNDVPENSDFVIVANGEENLFVVNVGEADLPLGQLRLGNEMGDVNGDEWGIKSIWPGECVSMWQDGGNPLRPEGLSCDQVGDELIRPRPVRFWKTSFDIYYDEELVGKCVVDMDTSKLTTCVVDLGGD
jgi:hypothetical protein